MSSTPLHSTLVGDHGPVVMFFHGLFGRGRNFSGIARALQPDYRCLLVDLPNHGASPWTDRIDYTEMAALVAAHLRQALPREDAVAVVGHSMGGKVAMMLALTEPGLVERLAVVDISPTGAGETSEFEHLLGSLARIDLSAVHNFGDADRALSADVAQPTLRGFLLQNLRRNREAGTFAWQPNLELLRRDLAVVASDIPHGDAVYEGPVLWIAGADSGYVADEQMPTMRALFPRTQLIRIKDAGHWVHSQQPEVFTSALRYFLSRDFGKPS
ncbi:MAG: alpha/beta fold hydrolase [Ornithinimicrobium sp.]|uniref:alpha/beta fold hydrolase n=1 Tax=Ornithinimicrobium sp. TaxID=1977084 RepID=UPI0026DF8B83|nr:alpha/beta fold hydrolase [Ornithinimicrobium sp.]MDO5738516.1 alpha/beta fold hydrolase [Ornithinimicrobium sp.]